MNISPKTVLLFQPSAFQAEVWRSVLSEHDIFVIWEEAYIDKRQIKNYFKTSESRPNLLIIDLKIQNAYELCRWCCRHYPLSKVILTTDPRQGSSSVIRRWALNQGIDELLINFQQENLLSDTIANVNCVLKALDCPPAKKATIIGALYSPERKNVTASLGAIQLKQPSISQQNTETTLAKNIPLIARYSMGLFIITLMIVTIALDISMLWLISPVQGLQRRVLFHIQEQVKNAQTKANNFEEVTDVPKGIFSYGGSTTWAPIRKVVDSKIAEEYPEFNLRYLPAIDATPGSGTGISMLLEGELDFSQSSRPIEQEEHVLAHQQGFTLKQYHVAIDAIAIAVHPSLPVSGLTIDQLKKIYLGQITNWNEVDGPDLPIVLFSRQLQNGGTVEFFQHHVLHHQPFSSKVKYVYSTTDGLQHVGHTPGGIYYASAPEVLPQCTVKSLSIANSNGDFIPPYLPPAVPSERCPEERNQLNVAAIRNATYPITRYLYTIVKHDGGRAQKGGETYTKLLLTPEMQKLIEEAGFVPIN